MRATNSGIKVFSGVRNNPTGLLYQRYPERSSRTSVRLVTGPIECQRLVNWSSRKQQKPRELPVQTRPALPNATPTTELFANCESAMNSLNRLSLRRSNPSLVPIQRLPSSSSAMDWQFSHIIVGVL